MRTKIFEGASKAQPPSLDDVAQLLKAGKAKKIVLMTGVWPIKCLCVNF
jgi:hypothetical protein